jgi:dienelactone hydrolase
MTMRRAGMTMLLLLAGAPAAAQDAPIWSNVQVPVVAVPEARPAGSPLPGRLALPAGAGPFPAMIVLHGCGGVAQREHDWAVRLTGWGYAALVLDSFTPRGAGNICRATRSISSFDRAGDVLAAGLFLRTLPAIDGNAIGVIGFSHGGGSIVSVTREQFAGLYPGLIKAGVNYYGGCSNNPQVQRVIPMLVLIGESDDWVSAKDCVAYREQVRTTQPVEIVVYPGAYHDFDTLTAHGDAFGHHVEYDPIAAADSFARTRAFLDRWVRQLPSG